MLSFQDFSTSMVRPILRSITFPIPEHVLHIPFGLLKEKKEAGPTYGLPILEKKQAQRIVQVSLFCLNPLITSPLYILLAVSELNIVAQVVQQARRSALIIKKILADIFPSTIKKTTTKNIVSIAL